MVKRTATERNGSRSQALDLFAGCGGLSLGFRTAGFGVLGGVEVDPVAAATHGANFHRGSDLHRTPLDAHMEPQEVLARLGQDPEQTIVEVLIGGPPCQAFARVGRAKLRSESSRRNGHKDHRAWLRDPRADLYQRYLHFVDTLRPLALLMENVPDALNHGGDNVVEEICDELDRHGYDVAYTLINAVHFGVPQMRERMFLVGYRRDLRVGAITWPRQTHGHTLPPGYRGTKACALRPLQLNGPFMEPTRYRELPATGRALAQAITVEEALADLPVINAIDELESGELRRGARRLDVGMPYRTKTQSTYARLMRSWPGFECDDSVTAHVIRYLPRDYRIFRGMKPGDQYPQAHLVAQKLLAEQVRRQLRPPEMATQAYRDLEASFVPPYDATKFPNKWRKMEPDQPARTLMAHLGKDSYSHIHHDSRQARTISVREAARLQSFPDAFRFLGSMNAGFRQIGNAVPPLVAYALARHMREQLGLRQMPDFRTGSPALATNHSAKAARR